MPDKDALFKPHKRDSRLAVASKFIMNIVRTTLISILALAFGFWLIMASNMGPVYLPQIMDGGLDIWIRGLLLAFGLAICLATAIWVVLSIYHGFKHLFDSTK